MKALLPSLAILSAAVLASPAAAQVAGPWRVSGEISGSPFALDCRFEPHGADFGGVCVEAATANGQGHAGASHKLTKGAVVGNQVRWTYQASFMLAKFDVNFAGTLEGDHMSGTANASGRKGEFTATRK